MANKTRRGFVFTIFIHYLYTMGTKNVSIKRENVERLLNDLINQANMINANPDKKTYPCTVNRLWVFGSYVNSEKTHLGDIDIFYDFSDRWKDPADSSNFFIDRDNPHINNILDHLYYPENLTVKILRNGHRAFSFINFNNLSGFKPDPTREMIYKLIYKYE
jgi:hypothetical protein